MQFITIAMKMRYFIWKQLLNGLQMDELTRSASQTPRRGTPTYAQPPLLAHWRSCLQIHLPHIFQLLWRLRPSQSQLLCELYKGAVSVALYSDIYI